MLGIQERITGSWLIALVTILDAGNSCWFGYDQGVFAGVLVSPDFLARFPSTQNADISGITSSCFFLGAGLGAICAFLLGDKLGRRRTIALGLLCNTVGALLQTLAWHLPQMVVGRLINGFGIGLVSSMSPVYLSECCKSNVRGMLMGIATCCNVGCFCIANWIAYGLYYRGDAFQWRFPLAFQLVFLFIIAPILAILPDSPRWLLLQDRDEDALFTLSRLMGHNQSVEDADVLAEFASIKSAIRMEREDQVPLRDVLCSRDRTQNLRRLMLSCGTQFFQQFTGINAWGFYLPTLLQEFVGYDQQMSRLISAASSTVYVGSSFACLMLIDRIGRRKMMMYSPVFIGACLLIAAIALEVGENDMTKKSTMGKVATAMVLLYHVFFGLGFSTVPWVYSAEVNSLGWRTRGAAAATSVNWFFGFVVVQITKIGLDHLKWRFFLMFAVFSFAISPIIYLFYPETSNRTLEDMDQIFIHNPSAFVFKNRFAIQSGRPQLFIDAEALRIAHEENNSREAVLAPDEKNGLPRFSITEV
ncbi:putative sugar transporter [Coniella lustricola]|uniref:Putative sugar transporter n=1 Tax=Coniella lustricola TaxID=2025994 RepID=A0A2T2ZWS4_9PEZI|nr:putative sugar transporter [Coniella lustricola]